MEQSNGLSWFGVAWRGAALLGATATGLVILGWLRGTEESDESPKGGQKTRKYEKKIAD
jgi:hypothetical protein